jgi:hypothetical protein
MGLRLQPQRAPETASKAKLLSSKSARTMPPTVSRRLDR